MNEEMTEPEWRQRWAKLAESVKGSERSCRRWMRFYSTVSLIYAFFALTQILAKAHWVPTLVNLLICWWFYRLYRWNRKCYELWRILFHHTSRVLPETEARAHWHMDQMDGTIEQIKNVNIFNA